MTTTTPKGITQMTMSSHRFEGFAVRAVLRGWHFLSYVSAAPKKWPAQSGRPRTLNARRRLALSEAKSKNAFLRKVITDPASWKNGTLSQKAHNGLSNDGFKINAAS